MPPTASFWMPPGRQLTAVMPLFALLGGRGRPAGKQYHRYRNQSGECSLSVGALRGTHHFVLCQLPISRPGCGDTCHSRATNAASYGRTDSPCGACRQVMLETEKRFKRPMRILLSGEKGIYELRSVGALLPLSFDASSML